MLNRLKKIIDEIEHCDSDDMCELYGLHITFYFVPKSTVDELKRLYQQFKARE